MRTASSSKTHSVVTALIALGLAVAAGFAYWGLQSWERFNSNYYTQGYKQEAQQETPLILEQGS